MTEVRPLRDDPNAPATLRRDLETFAEHVEPFDVAVGLDTLQRTLAAGRPLRPWPWVSVVAVGLGLGAAVWFSSGGSTERRRMPPAEVSAAGAPLAETDVGGQPPTATSTTEVGAADADGLGESQPPSAQVEAPPLGRTAAPSAEETAAPAVAAHAASRTPDAPSPGGDSSQDEIAHMARLRTLATEDPAAALAMVRDGNRRFAGGLFAQERQAVEVLMLARLGRRQAAARLGRRFLREHPESALGPRVRRAIAP